MDGIANSTSNNTLHSVNNTSDGTSTFLFTRDSVIVKFTTTIVIGLLSIVGNSVMLYVISKSRHLLEHKTAILVWSLIATDLESSLMLIYYASAQLKVYVFSSDPCQFLVLAAVSQILFRISVTAEKLILISITVDRYIAILHPLEYETKFTNRNAKQVIVVSWMMGLLAGLVTSIHLIGLDFSSCQPPYSLITMGVLDNGVYAVVVSVMIVAYARIMKVLIRQRSTISGLQRRSNETNSRRMKPELKAVRVLAVVLGTYTVLWLPYQVGRFLQVIGDTAKYTQIIVDVGMVLGSINYALDWLNYGVGNRSFKKAVKNMLFHHRQEGTIPPRLNRDTNTTSC